MPSAEQTRAALRRWPTGVIVATTVVEGVDYSMTANSMVSVCLDPPLMLLCVERGTQFHEAVSKAGFWAATVLEEGQADLAQRLSHRGRPPGRQLEGIAVERGASGAALIDGGLSHFECHVRSVVPGGDHDVLLSDVTSVRQSANDSLRPLVYWARTFHTVGDHGSAPA